MVIKMKSNILKAPHSSLIQEVIDYQYYRGEHPLWVSWSTISSSITRYTTSITVLRKMWHSLLNLAWSNYSNQVVLGLQSFKTMVKLSINNHHYNCKQLVIWSSFLVGAEAVLSTWQLTIDFKYIYVFTLFYTTRDPL